MGRHEQGNRYLTDPFGDDKYNRLFDELYAPLCRYCMKFVHNCDTAEDIVQEQFIYLWENWKRLNNFLSIKSYLFKAVKNKSLNYLRKEFAKNSACLTEDLADTLRDDSLPAPDELLESKELEAILEKGLESLPLKCRTIFTLKRFAGLTNKEIAEHLHISKKTVEAQTTIALKKLSAFVSTNWGLFSLILINCLLRVS